MNGFRFKAKSQGRYGKRHKPGEMNKTEQAYSELLQARKLAGEIVDWWFEPMRFILADLCTLTLDFGVLHLDGSMEFIDAKGGPIADDALVKIKAAAEKFYMFTFAMEQKQTKKAGGGWKRREF